MCVCDWNHTCPQCAGTPFAPNYENDEPLTPDDFDSLTPSTAEWRTTP